MTGMRLAAAFMLALALTGCSGSDAPAAPVAPSSAPAPAASPMLTPTEVSKADAGRRYLALVAPNNEAVTALGDYVDTLNDRAPVETLPRAESLAAEAAEANRSWSQGLLAGPWPTDIALTANQLAAALAARQGPLRAMADAETGEQWFEALRLYANPSDPANGLAELMRQQLGLPERGTS